MKISLQGKKALLFLLPVVGGILLYRFLPSLRPSRSGPILGANGPAGISAPAVAIEYGPDGSLYCLSVDGNVQKFLPDEGRWRSFHLKSPTRVSFMGGKRFKTLRVSQDGNTLYSPYPDQFIVALDTKTRKELYTTFGSANGVFDVSEDGNWMAVAAPNGVIVSALNTQATPARKRASGLPLPTNYRRFKGRLLKFKGGASAVALSPDGKLLAVGNNGAVHLFETQSNAKLPSAVTFINHSAPSFGERSDSTNDNMAPFYLKWSHDGSQLAVLSIWEITLLDNNLQVLKSSRSEQELGVRYYRWGGFDINGYNLDWTTDGKYLISSGAAVHRWRVNDMRLEGQLEHQGFATLTPSEKSVVIAGPLENTRTAHLIEVPLSDFKPAATPSSRPPIN